MKINDEELEILNDSNTAHKFSFSVASCFLWFIVLLN